MSPEDKSCEWDFYRELPERTNSDNSLGMGLLQCFKHILPPPVSTRLLCFTAILVVRLLFFKAAAELRVKRQMGIGKHSKSHCYY